MKQLIIFSFLLCAVKSNGQSVTKDQPVSNPLWFLDSIRVPLLPIFSPDKISDIQISKNNPDGAIYITSRKPNDFHFLSLLEIVNQHLLKSASYLFIIDDELIKDTTGMRIDSSYILRCETVNGTEIKYLPNPSQFMIINIKTRSKANLDKENILHIRGKETVSLHW